MKKNDLPKKIAFKFLIHLIELVLLYVVSIWIYNVAPVGYALPAVLLLVIMYVFYLISSLIDDYLDLKGADFMI